MEYAKVFCIGAPKTGTTSLHHALEELGFRHKTWDRDLWQCYKKGELDAVFEAAEQFDSFDDGPWNNDNLYQKLDRRFPGSKFILTEREPFSWLQSHEEHFTAVRLRYNPHLIWRRSYSAAKRRRVLGEYLERNCKIKEYFRGRPDDLLVMNVCGGEGWEKLCPFLGIPRVEEPFPQENVTAERPPRTTYHIWKRIIANGIASLRHSVKQPIKKAVALGEHILREKTPIRRKQHTSADPA